MAIWANRRAMSDQDTGTATEYQKEVVMLAYPAEGAGYTKREWADEMTPEDMHEKTTYEDENLKLSIDAGRNILGREWSAHRYEDSAIEELSDRLEDIDSISLNIVKETRSEFKHSLNSCTRAVIKDCISMLPDDIPLNHRGIEVLSRSEHSTHWKDGKCDWKASVWDDGMGLERVLSKESEREDDDLYESIGEVPCMRTKIRFKAPREELIDEWTNTVVAGLHKELSGIPAIGRVRYTSCEVTETKAGECYNV